MLCLIVFDAGETLPQRSFTGPRENIMENLVRVLLAHLMRIETLRGLT